MHLPLERVTRKNKYPSYSCFVYLVNFVRIEEFTGSVNAVCHSAAEMETTMAITGDCFYHASSYASAVLAVVILSVCQSVFQSVTL